MLNYILRKKVVLNLKKKINNKQKIQSQTCYCNSYMPVFMVMYVFLKIFSATCPGTYTSEICMYLNNYPSQYKLTLSGKLRSPKINFHPPFLMLMPVPLDVESEAVVTIIPQEFIR